MNRHNITGSEAFSSTRPYPVQEVSRGRPSRGRVVRWHVIACVYGGAISAADVVIGSPVCLCITLAAAFVWARMPDRR